MQTIVFATGGAVLSLLGGAAVSGDLSLSIRAAPNPAFAGDELTYTVSVANAGPDAVAEAHALFELTIPRRSGAIAVASPSWCRSDGDALICRVGGLPSGGRRTFLLRVRPTASGTATLLGIVLSEATDATRENNVVRVRVPVRRPFRLTFRATDQRPLAPRAGHKFFVNLQVARSDTGQLLTEGRLSCRAAIGGRVLTVVQRETYPVPTCLWRIPARTKGDILRVSVAVAFRGQTVRRSLRFRIL